MNKIILAAAAIALFIACNGNKTADTASADTITANVDTAAAQADTTSAPAMVFEQPKYDFGMVHEGEKVSYQFKFKNTGKSPLIISSAMASCGCTVPDYPKTPVAPGQEGVISVVFNSANQSGKQSKTITITSNSIPPVTEVYLTGEVQKANK